MTNKPVLRIFAVLLLTGLFVTLPASQTTTQAAPAAVPANITYYIYATDGYAKLADGNTAYIYGFIGGRQGVDLKYLDQDGVLQTLAGGPPKPMGGPIVGNEEQLRGNAQFPAPVIYARVGDVVTIYLKNLGTTNPSAPNDPHSIHLHGLDVNAANDGVPETSIGAVPANSEDPGAGNVVVYMFTAKYPGTYLYHCHQEASIHVQMGMYGAMVIYGATDIAGTNGPGTGSGTLFNFKYDRDYILLMSEFDMQGHAAEEFSTEWNWAYYEPEYWFLNGLGFPNTIHAGAGFNWLDWKAAHPGYDPFIVGSVGKKSFCGTTGEKVLLRMINVGFETHPMHMHGFHGKVLGSDQRPSSVSPFALPGIGPEKNTLLIGSGETYEWLIDFGTQKLTGTYHPETQTRQNNGAPSANTSGDPAIPDLFSDDALELSGSTFIGGPVVGPGTGDENAAAAKLVNTTIPGQLFPFHNHDDYKATNNGAYPGGMFTMIMTLP